MEGIAGALGDVARENRDSAVLYDGMGGIRAGFVENERRRCEMGCIFCSVLHGVYVCGMDKRSEKM